MEFNGKLMGSNGDLMEFNGDFMGFNGELIELHGVQWDLMGIWRTFMVIYWDNRNYSGIYDAIFCDLMKCNEILSYYIYTRIYIYNFMDIQ
jgi:hypothetical protein